MHLRIKEDLFQLIFKKMGPEEQVQIIKNADY